jgi:hypothetical protein
LPQPAHPAWTALLCLLCSDVCLHQKQVLFSSILLCYKQNMLLCRDQNMSLLCDEWIWTYFILCSWILWDEFEHMMGICSLLCDEWIWNKVMSLLCWLLCQELIYMYKWVFFVFLPK